MPTRPSFLRRFLRARRGATAVEFALVGLPFFALLFSILELGMMFMTQTTIEASAISNARLIRTGQLQAGGANSAAGFKTLVCNGMSWISTADCMAHLSVDVQTFSDFSSLKVSPPIRNGALDQSQMTFNAGASCDIVLVQVFYPYSLITPLLEPGLPNLNDHQRLLTTAVAFRNENWQVGGVPCS
ncbi:MAG TPA: TadE/TadG family type IV pilus assembly protein [Caulobacteraceae bacterium]|jgi:Flp pilus assembly protein TadG